jgi:prevent-host-death family protein
MKRPLIAMGTSIVGRLRTGERFVDNEKKISYKSSEPNSTMTRLNVSKARDEFPELVNRAAYGGERTIVSRRGKDLAAVIPIEDLRLLEKLAREEMDRQDIEDARASLAEPGENISIEDFIRELGD